MHPLPSWNFKVTTSVEIKRTIALREYICSKLHCFWCWGNQFTTSEMSITNHRVSLNSVKFRKELCLNSQNTTRSNFLAYWIESSPRVQQSHIEDIPPSVFGQNGHHDARLGQGTEALEIFSWCATPFSWWGGYFRWVFLVGLLFSCGFAEGLGFVLLFCCCCCFVLNQKQADTRGPKYL